MEVWNWVKLHWIEIGVAVGYLVAFARIVVSWTPSPKDDSVLESIVAFVRKFTLTIPPPASPPSPEVGREKAINSAPDGSAVRVPLMPAPAFLETMGLGARDRPLRCRVRRLAKLNGLDISELEDAEIDEAIEQAKGKWAIAARDALPRGPIAEFFAWLVANPEVILAILRLFTMDRANTEPV